MSDASYCRLLARETMVRRWRMEQERDFGRAAVVGPVEQDPGWPGLAPCLIEKYCDFLPE